MSSRYEDSSTGRLPVRRQVGGRSVATRRPSQGEYATGDPPAGSGPAVRTAGDGVGPTAPLLGSTEVDLLLGLLRDDRERDDANGDLVQDAEHVCVLVPR